MKIYKKIPEYAKCQICKTNENKLCTLIAIDGTSENRNEEASKSWEEILKEELNEVLN